MKILGRVLLFAVFLISSLLAVSSVFADPPFQGLRLTGMSACDNTRTFRVRNSNAFDVPFTWRSTATGETGSDTAAPGDSFLTINGGNTTFIINWNYSGNSGSQTKSSNNTQNCPQPTPDPTPENTGSLSTPEAPVYVPPVFEDGRCNPEPWASAVLYRTDAGFEMFGIFDDVDSEGYSLFEVAQEAIDAYGDVQDAVLLGQATSVYGGLVELWLLPMGELQIHAAALPSHAHDWYDYVFSECV
ncbi:MAG: hypothetical protein RLP44_21045 [Aggregatilineales bacterium]